MDEVGGRITFGEAIDHVETLIDTPGTHIHAAVNDWLWPATETDLAIILHTEWYMNVHRAKGVREITLPRPWSGAQKSADVTDEEREILRAQLIATSPFQH